MWRIRKNNLIINEHDNFFSHRTHLEKLLYAKPHVQNKGPKMPFFLKNKYQQIIYYVQSKTKNAMKMQLFFHVC